MEFSSEHRYEYIIFNEYGICPYIIKVILKINSDPSRPPIDILARITPSLLPEVESKEEEERNLGDRTVVALRQGRLLITTFHPELTRDDRFHDYFVRNCVSDHSKV